MSNPNQEQAIDQRAIGKIALEHLHIETLETQNRDRYDFHDLAVWSIKSALEAAYAAGASSAQNKSTASKDKK